MNNEDLRLKNEEYTKAKLLPPARQELRFGDPSGTRTPDPLLKRQLLYRLS